MAESDPREGDAAADSRGRDGPSSAAGDAPAAARTHAEAIADPLIALALALLALGWFSLTLDRGVSLLDEGYLLHMGARVATGEVPHRDFIEIYGPGALGATGLALRMGDGEVLAVRWLIALFKAAAVAFTYLIARRLLPRSGALLAAAIALAYWGRAVINLNTPHASLFTIPLCQLSLLVLLWADERRTRLAWLWVGVAAGLPILFKQSIGLMSAYGIGLSLALLAVLDPIRTGAPDESERTRERGLLLTAWALGGLALMLPTLSFLDARAYALHILPIHLLMGFAALAVRRTGSTVGIRAILERLLPYSAGIAAVLLPVAALYASLGALDELIYDMFVFPPLLTNYALRSALPPIGVATFGAGGLLVVCGALLALRGCRNPGLAGVALGAAAMALAAFVLPHANPRLYTPAVVWQTATVFDWLASSAILLAVMPLIGQAARDPARPEADTALRVLLPVSLFQAFLCFQVFPRAGVNVWIVEGAFAPLLTYALWRAGLWAAPPRLRPIRRAAAWTIVAVVPLWILAPLVVPVLWPGPGSAFSQPVGLPHTRGLVVSPGERTKQRLDDFRELVAHLGSTRPADARLLLFGAEEMLAFASGRRHLVPRRDFYVYMTAYDMLPRNHLSRETDADLRRELERRPETIVIVHHQPASARMRRALPRTSRFVETHYRTEREIGDYSILKRMEASSGDAISPPGSGGAP